MPNLQEHVTVVQIGGYPPPHGGVGVHVQELAARLRGQSISCGVLSNAQGNATLPSEPGVRRFKGSRPRQFTGMLRALRMMTPDIVHVHIAYGAQALPWAALFTRIVPLRASLVTIHSGLFPAVVSSASSPKRRVYRGSLDAFGLIIAVNPHIRDAVCSLGISREKIRIIPAFFPDSGSALSRPDADLMNLRERRDILLFTSGFMHPDWGILTAARALHAINDINAGLVVIQSGERAPEYERQVRAALPDPKRALFYREVPHERFLAILSAADIYIRASLYDGDSNAVREALSAGKLVIASDCVPRPEGCLLFRTSCQNALDGVLRSAVSQHISALTRHSVMNSQLLLSLYHELLGQSVPEGSSAAGR